MDTASGQIRRKPEWKRFVAAGLLLAIAVPVLLIPLMRAERMKKELPPGLAKGPDANDPVAHLSGGPRNYDGIEAIQNDYRSALTSYEAFLVRADSDIAFLERFCSGEPVNTEDGVARAKSMAQFFQNAKIHEIDMSEMRRVAALKNVDFGQPPWESHQQQIKELTMRLTRSQNACRERNRQRAKAP